MLLAIDIGNTAIKLGVFEGQALQTKLSIPTERDHTADGLKALIGESLDLPITDCIVCSVVPEVHAAVRQFVHACLGVETVFVDNTYDLGLTIRYETIETLGTDRLVNAFAAAEKYGVPVIVCSLGTATTIDAVNAKREYLGGIIAPGMRMMARSLHLETSQLPLVDPEQPTSVIGISTEGSLRSGIVFGYQAMVEGLIEMIRGEMGSDPRIIATGGNAALVAGPSKRFDILDEDLTLEGLRLLAVRRGRIQ